MSFAADVKAVQLAPQQHDAESADSEERSSPAPAKALASGTSGLKASSKAESRANLLMLLDTVMPGDNAELLQRIEARMKTVGLSFPGIEVRWNNLTAEAVLPRGSEKTTTLWNTVVEGVKALESLFVSEKLTHKRHVMLDGVSGVLKPGRMTLLLGPPGAGKTTLLRSLAGQMRHNKAVKFTGDITYNGQVPGQDFVVERAAAYVEQADEHAPMLTVAETLYFASEMLGPGLSKVLHDMLTARERELGITPDPALEAMWVATFQDKSQSIWVNMFTRVLGIEHVMDTVVGDQQLKGISGGQCRRVTTGELAVGLLQCMFLDEISTGLDSATTYSMIKGLRNLCKHMNTTYMISLLQPSPETFDLFDDVMVMAGRRIVFHGPREDVLPFFAGLGFHCPPSKTAPDFLQEVVTTTDQHRYWDVSRAPHQYVSSKRIAAHYLQSPQGQAARAVLDSPPYQHEHQDLVLHKNQYALSWGQQFKAVFVREVVLACKKWALAFVIFNMVQMAFVGFITSTAFVQLGKHTYEEANLFLSVIFFALMVMFMGGFNFAPIFTRRLPVFYKQRAQHFHDVWTWVISGSLIHLPELALGTSVYAIMVFFSVGFTRTAGHFFIWWLLLFSQNWFGMSLFQFMGALTGNDVMAQGLGAVVGLMMICTGGFAIARTSIGGWLIWVYWINPMSWVFRALAINELTSSDWDTSAAPTGPADQAVGVYTLESRGFYTEWFWVWAGVGYVIGFTILLNIGQGLALMYLGPNITNNLPPVEEEDGELKSDADVAVNVVRATAAAAQRKQAVPPVDAHGQPLPPAATRGSALPFTPVTLAFHGVEYFVPKPGKESGELQLLRDCYGSFKPGVLTALMGASGAGKTTLMDVLAGRKTAGRMTGVQTVNGHEKEQHSFARVMGYVEQLDVHVEQATVYEALMFSARLRLAEDIDEETRNAFVDEVMDLVELDVLARRLVGTLTTEQRKRLTIAVELVANPSVLFADEPTSGLDSRAALVVMKVLRNIVNTGRTVVCTIHQPSTEIFTAFDELLLLKPGGRVIYNGPLGPNGSTLIDYMCEYPEVQRPPPTANPSVFMLEVSEPAAEKQYGVDWAERWMQSSRALPSLEEVQALCQPAPGSSPITFAHRNATNLRTQWWLLFERNMTTHWRLPSYNVLRFGVTIMLGFFLGLLYLNRGDKTSDMTGVLDILGALYTTTLFMGIVNLLIVLPVVNNERPAYYREKSSGMYGAVAYSTAQGAAELIYLFVQGVVYTNIVYWLVGFETSAAKFFWFYLFFQLSLVIFTFFGYAAMHLAPSVELATNGGSFFVLLWNVFCGFLIAKDQIRPWWIWAYYFNPTTYVLYGTITTQLGDVWDKDISTGPDSSQPVAQFIADTYSYKYSFRGWLVLILVGFFIAERTVALTGLAKLNFQVR